MDNAEISKYTDIDTARNPNDLAATIARHIEPGVTPDAEMAKILRMAIAANRANGDEGGTTNEMSSYFLETLHKHFAAKAGISLSREEDAKNRPDGL